MLIKNPQTSSCRAVRPKPGARNAQEFSGTEYRPSARRAGTTVSKRFNQTSSGNSGEVFDLRVVGREIAPAGDPADVRPPETVDMRRVGVVSLVGMLVVVTMMIRPPQAAALNRGGAPKCQKKLAEARGAVRLVREVAMVNARHGEHPQEVEDDGSGHCERAPSDPHDSDAAGMEDEERDASDPIDSIRLSSQLSWVDSRVISVEPLGASSQQTPEGHCLIRRTMKFRHEGGGAMKRFSVTGPSGGGMARMVRLTQYGGC